MTSRIFQSKDDRRNTLIDDFRDIGTNTWNLMANGYSSGMNISEETITEIVLLELKLKHPENVFIKQVGKKTEAKIGADWLWAFVGRNKSVFGMCVQAKRLFPNRAYKNIIEERDNPTKQVNKLIRDGASYRSFTGKKLYPLYVFYNTWDEERYKGAKDFFEHCCEQDQSHTILGCTYADAFDVKQNLLSSKTFLDDYKAISYPLSCLISCTTKSKQDLAESLCRRFITLNDSASDIFGNLRESEYLTTLDEAHVVKSLMLNEANEQLLAQLRVKGVVVIKQD